MIDKSQILPLNFFKYGGIYTGEHRGMRYRIEKSGEKPDFKLIGSIWQAPYSYGAVKETDIVRKEFECSEAGREELIDWLLRIYNEKIEYWQSAPTILEAPIDLSAIYKDGK